MKKKVLGMAVVATLAIVATIGFMTTQKGGSDSKMFSNVEALAAGEGSVITSCCIGLFGGCQVHQEKVRRLPVLLSDRN